MLVRETYLSLIIYSIFSLVIVLILYLVSYTLSVKAPNTQKLSVYECGFEPINSTQSKFNIKFYLVALLFVLFDLEIVFVFPWAINLAHLGLFGYYSMIFFLGILTLGFVYEYKKGALEW